MRSNSGKDESRNNLRDPTLRDLEQQKKQATRATGPGQGTAEMGSSARKSGQRGQTRQKGDR